MKRCRPSRQPPQALCQGIKIDVGAEQPSRVPVLSAGAVVVRVAQSFVAVGDVAPHLEGGGSAVLAVLLAGSRQLRLRSKAAGFPSPSTGRLYGCHPAYPLRYRTAAMAQPHSCCETSQFTTAR
jgi:hypothetical protein